MDDTWDTYNPNATYDDGSCVNLQIGIERDNPSGNTVTGYTEFYFYGNYGTVDGDANFYDYEINYNTAGGGYNYGEVTGFANFNNSYWGYGADNYGTVGNGAYFGYYSSNNGTVDNGATFEYGYNNGTINGTADFTQGGSYYAYNYGTVDGDAYFYSNDYNYGYYNYGTVTGTVTYYYGCTDSNAANYDPNAIIVYSDSYSCEYYGINIDLPAELTYTGNLDFYYYNNNGTVDGDANFYDYDYYGWGNGGGGYNYGEVTGYAYFNNGYWGYGADNYGTIGNGAYFGYYSYNYGIVDNGATFEGGYNSNIVNGDAYFWYGGNEYSGTINGTADFTQGGNYYAYNYGTVNGDAYFNSNNDYSGYYNYGTVNGTIYNYYGCTDTNAVNYDSSAVYDDSSCVFYGQNSDLPGGTEYTGDLIFDYGYSNYGTINGNVTFYTGSGSANYGTVNGDVTFYGYDTGSTGIVTVDDNYSNNFVGTGDVNGIIYDDFGTEITQIVFAGNRTNEYVIDTDIDVIFIENSYLSNNQIGDVTFNTEYYSSTPPTDGIFRIENANWQSHNVNGTIYGSDNNPIIFFDFYNSTINYATISGDARFNDDSQNRGIIEGDMIVNSEYYGPITTTATLTLDDSAEWRGTVNGTIYASDELTEITNFVFTNSSKNYATINVPMVTFSNSASNFGTINGDATFNGTTFRIGTVNGTATLSGPAQILQGVNNVINFVKQLVTGRDTFYLTAGSSLNVSGLFTLLGLDANNLLSVRSTLPGSYANIGINGTLNFDFLRLKDIRNTGTLVDLSTKTVFDDGHNSGFTFPSNSTPGSRGGVTGEYTAPSLPPSRGGESPGGSTGGESTPSTPSSSGGGTSQSGLINNIANPNIDPINFIPIQQFTPFGESFVPSNLGATVIPDPFVGFNPPGQISFIQLPTNFLPNISSFLFAPIPSTIMDALANAPRLQSYMGSVGLSTEQDLASLTANPEQLEAPDEDNLPPGLFLIKSGNNILTSYATYDQAGGGLAQLVKVSPSQSLSISLVPLSTGEVNAEYLGQTITFQSSNNLSIAYITSSNNAGRYVLTTQSSPIPLLIEVEVPTEQVPTKKPWGIFYFIWKLLFE
jgi:hypothetical protein